MTDKEAMKLALDALETEVSIDWTNNDEFNASAEKMHEAIAALNARLTQPEQEPVAWPCLIDSADFSKGTITIVMQCEDYKVSAGTHWLSPTPPQRTWVDLTDTQIEQVYFEMVQEHRGAPMPWGQVQFGKALLKKFREVNK